MDNSTTDEYRTAISHGSAQMRPEELYQHVDLVSDIDPTKILELEHTYEIKKHSTITDADMKKRVDLAGWLGLAGALGGSERRYRPMGFGMEPRKSTIKSKERKKRTAKKKSAKHSRRKNRG